MAATRTIAIGAVVVLFGLLASARPAIANRTPADDEAAAAPGAVPEIVGPPGLLAQGREARAALAPLKRGLMATLSAAMKNGPESAVDACRLAAPGIAEAAATPRYTVGRTSERLRNPANAAADWMRPLLDRYARSPELSAGTVVALEGGAVGYVEPIRVKPLCTTCHGTSVDPDLLDHIRERYPDDRATGYAEGDLRGLFWVVARPAADPR